MSGELFKMMTGIDMIHVPYRGGALALTDLIGGQVQVMFDNIPTAHGVRGSGKLRGFAVTGAARSETLPDLPTVADFRAGLRGDLVVRTSARPRARPRRSSNSSIARSTRSSPSPRLKARFLELGASLLPGSPADFGKLVADETEKWGKVVKFSGAKVT